MYNYFKWIILLLSFRAIVISCASDQNETQTNVKESMPKIESKLIDTETEDPEDQEGDFDGYGIQVNRVEVRPVLGEALQLELDTVILAKNGKPFKDYFLTPTSGTRNLKFVYADGIISDNRLNPVIGQFVYVDAAECGNEEGVQWQILEDGTGIVVVCKGAYIKVNKFIGGDPSKKKERSWIIREEKVEGYHNISRTEIGLTHDGKYLYKVNLVSLPTEGSRKVYYEVTKYDIVEEELIWTKKIEENRLKAIWCISPDNKLIFTKGKTLVDENFDLIKEFEHYGDISIDRAMPQFFRHEGKQLLMIPTAKAISIVDCGDDSNVDEIWFLEIKYIQYCYVHENQIIMQVVLADDEKSMLTIQLDDLSNIQIRPNEKNLVRGLDNRLLQANEKEYKVYTIIE